MTPKSLTGTYLVIHGISHIVRENRWKSASGFGPTDFEILMEVHWTIKNMGLGAIEKSGLENIKIEVVS